MTVIFGLNGTGKTTLFKIITGEIKTNAYIQNSFNNIFYLAQTPYCPKNVTVFDYLSSIFFKNNLKWFLSKEEKEKILKALDNINLLDKKDIFVEKLSGGEFQKVNLVLSMLSNADLLLLDEPVSNLDILNQKWVLDTIKSLDITSVIILHDLNLAVNYADNFIAIDKNKKILQGAKEEFFTPENLKNAFNTNFEIIKNNEKYHIQVID